MRITIDDRIRTATPDLALGVVSAHVEVAAEDAELRADLERTAEWLRQELAGSELSQVPEIQALRRLYHRLGKDPTRYRGANEALLRRIVQGKGLYFINSAVDVCNLVSIETRHSLGAFDLDRIEGDVTLRPAPAGEVYRGIGRGEINLEGLPVFCDAAGPFGSPTSDSERTKITLASRRIALVIIACCRRERLEQDMARAADLLRRHAKGTDVGLQVQAAGSP
jgi:DNA/RNA-binding domain of Phe-tRNA-synthetase-like protein